MVFSIVDFVGDGPERLCAIQPGSLGNESKLPGNKLSLDLGNKLRLLGNATPSEDNQPREDSTQVSDASNTVFSRVNAPVNASSGNTSFYNGALAQEITVFRFLTRHSYVIVILTGDIY